MASLQRSWIFYHLYFMKPYWWVVKIISMMNRIHGKSLTSNNSLALDLKIHSQSHHNRLWHAAECPGNLLLYVLAGFWQNTLSWTIASICQCRRRQTAAQRTLVLCHDRMIRKHFFSTAGMKCLTHQNTHNATVISDAVDFILVVQ